MGKNPGIKLLLEGAVKRTNLDWFRDGAVCAVRVSISRCFRRNGARLNSTSVTENAALGVVRLAGLDDVVEIRHDAGLVNGVVCPLFWAAGIVKRVVSAKHGILGLEPLGLGLNQVLENAVSDLSVERRVELCAVLLNPFLRSVE